MNKAIIDKLLETIDGITAAFHSELKNLQGDDTAISRIKSRLQTNTCTESAPSWKDDKHMKEVWEAVLCFLQSLKEVCDKAVEELTQDDPNEAGRLSVTADYLDAAIEEIKAAIANSQTPSQK